MFLTELGHFCHRRRGSALARLKEVIKKKAGVGKGEKGENRTGRKRKPSVSCKVREEEKEWALRKCGDERKGRRGGLERPEISRKMFLRDSL